MEHRVTPWDDYNYEAKTPDIAVATGVFLGATVFYYHHYKFLFYNSSIKARALRAAKYAPAFLIPGYLLGKALSMYKTKLIKRQLTSMEEYVGAHPEDFKTIVPKQFKDVLLEWHPCR